jgi:hypothetical protein
MGIWVDGVTADPPSVMSARRSGELLGVFENDLFVVPAGAGGNDHC